MAHRDTLKSTDLSEHDHEEGGGEKASHLEPILTGAAHGEVVPVGATQPCSWDCRLGMDSYG